MLSPTHRNPHRKYEHLDVYIQHLCSACVILFHVTGTMSFLPVQRSTTSCADPRYEQQTLPLYVIVHKHAHSLP